MLMKISLHVQNCDASIKMQNKFGNLLFLFYRCRKITHFLAGTKHQALQVTLAQEEKAPVAPNTKLTITCSIFELEA